jgi:hypothetical protein
LWYKDLCIDLEFGHANTGWLGAVVTASVPRVLQGSLAVSIHKILSAQLWRPIGLDCTFFLTTGLDCSCKATEEHVRDTPGQLANAILKDVEKREEAGRGGWRPNSTRYIKTD